MEPSSPMYPFPEGIETSPKPDYDYVHPVPEGINNCDFSTYERRVIGRNNPEIANGNIYGHIITGTTDNSPEPFCMNADTNKNMKNIDTVNKILKGELDMPIYIIQSHGAYDLRFFFDKNESTGEVHYYPGPDNSYLLNDDQFIINPTPLGSIQLSNETTNMSIELMFYHDKMDIFKNIFSTRFLETMISVDETNKDAVEKELLENTMFSPPSYETLNKTYHFFDNQPVVDWKFGIFQLNRDYGDGRDELIEQIISNEVFSPSEIGYENRILNVTMPGVYVDNVEAEQEFIQHVLSNNYTITEKDLVRIFGKGIYIVLNCSPILFTLYDYANGRTININFEMSESDMALISDYVPITQSINSELEAIAYNLNNRWYEMVQRKKIREQELIQLFYSTELSKYYQKQLTYDHIEQVDDYVQHMYSDADQGNIINYKEILDRISEEDSIMSYFNYYVSHIQSFISSLIIPQGGGVYRKHKKSNISRSRSRKHTSKRIATKRNHKAKHKATKKRRQHKTKTI
jgi:hypothetical protein